MNPIEGNNLYGPNQKNWDMYYKGQIYSIDSRCDLPTAIPFEDNPLNFPIKDRRASFKHISKTIDSFEQIDSLEISFLNSIPFGTYKLENRPKVDELKGLVYFKNGENELGIFCFNGNWIITLSEGPYVYEPLGLNNRNHLLQATFHTHPICPKIPLQYPSTSDLPGILSTIDSKSYIITEASLLEFGWDKKMFPNYIYITEEEVNRLARYWYKNEHSVEERSEKLDDNKVHQLWYAFFKKFYSLRDISWDNSMKIERLLESKEKLNVKGVE